MKSKLPIGLAYLLPLTWLIYILWKCDLLKRDFKGCYRCDPEIFCISRLTFDFKPYTGKTKKGTKFCGNWHWFNLIFWEIHVLIRCPRLNRYYVGEDESFP